MGASVGVLDGMHTYIQYSTGPGGFHLCLGVRQERDDTSDYVKEADLTAGVYGLRCFWHDSNAQNNLVLLRLTANDRQTGWMNQMVRQDIISARGS